MAKEQRLPKLSAEEFARRVAEALRPRNVPVIPYTDEEIAAMNERGVLLVLPIPATPTTPPAAPLADDPDPAVEDSTTADPDSSPPR